MKKSNFLAPIPLPFSYEEWAKQPFAKRINMLCIAWVTQGYGAPLFIYLFYLLKMLFYAGMWIFFCSLSNDLGGITEISAWWFAPEALEKFILWSMLFEVLGLGSGSGPLTGKYFPPIGGVLYFARPGTIKLPLFPNLPIVGNDKRGWLDVALYMALLGLLVRALIASHVTTDMLVPVVILLLLTGLTDKTIFLAARSDHYLPALCCFLFAGEEIAGAKFVWLAIWWGAATSKFTRHFPAVVCVMISNHPLLRWDWLKTKLYKNYPVDLRPGLLANVLGHIGTALEYGFPLLLIFGTGGQMTMIGLVIMFFFHLHITSSVPMGVPLEWNVIMVYGAFVLFGYHADVAMLGIHSPLLIAMLAVSLLIVPTLGNLFPKWISFLLSMRYYAGNWAYSIWLFKGNSEEKIDQYLVKTTPTVIPQLAKFYDEATSAMLVSKVIAFRSMHLHGRALQLLIPKAVDDIEQYHWRDGEIMAGIILGWNFGEGHLHDEQLLRAVQRRCSFESGELRCIFVESQPLGGQFMEWRIADAKDGQLAKGRVSIKELSELQPWAVC